MLEQALGRGFLTSGEAEQAPAVEAAVTTITGHFLLRSISNPSTPPPPSGVAASQQQQQQQQPGARLWDTAVTAGRNVSTQIEAVIAEMLQKVSGLSAGLETPLSSAVEWRARRHDACSQAVLSLWQLIHYLRTLQEGVLAVAATVEEAKEAVAEECTRAVEVATRLAAAATDAAATKGGAENENDTAASPTDGAPPDPAMFMVSTVEGSERVMRKCEELEVVVEYLERTQRLVTQLCALRPIKAEQKLLLDLEGCGVNGSTPSESTASIQGYVCPPLARRMCVRVCVCACVRAVCAPPCLHVL